MIVSRRQTLDDQKQSHAKAQRGKSHFCARLCPFLWLKKLAMGEDVEASKQR